jgi:hypothetical protein
MFAVFACVKNKNRALDVPCLDPLSYGRDFEPEPQLLLRRGRVQLFETYDDAESSLIRSKDAAKSNGHEPYKNFDYVFLKCQPPASGEGEGVVVTKSVS